MQKSLDMNLLKTISHQKTNLANLTNLATSSVDIVIGFVPNLALALWPRAKPINST